MKKIYCDCCKKELREFEQSYSITINKRNDKEYVLDDVCEDCFERFQNIISNAEKWRLSNN